MLGSESSPFDGHSAMMAASIAMSPARSARSRISILEAEQYGATLRGSPGYVQQAEAKPAKRSRRAEAPGLVLFDAGAKQPATSPPSKRVAE
jgi:hypothetical protein